MEHKLSQLDNAKVLKDFHELFIDRISDTSHLPKKLAKISIDVVLQYSQNKPESAKRYLLRRLPEHLTAIYAGDSLLNELLTELHDAIAA